MQAVDENIVTYMPQIKYLHLKMLAITFIYHCNEEPIRPFRCKDILNHRKEPKAISVEVLFHLLGPECEVDQKEQLMCLPRQAPCKMSYSIFLFFATVASCSACDLLHLPGLFCRAVTNVQIYPVLV